MEDLSNWEDEKLRRKRDQEQEMASMALSDGDKADYQRRMALAERYYQELLKRRG